LRAELFPPWKLALQNFVASSKAPGVFSLFAGALLLTLLFGFIIYVTAMRVVKTFVAELALARRAQRNLDERGANILSTPAKNDFPEILPGGIPSLSGSESPLGEAASTTLALGQRFDFLSSRQPPELAGLLAEEPAENIALLLASLAGSSPETAAAIFSALPSHKQKEASQALMGINATDPEKLTLVENKLRNLVEFGVRGPERLGRILSRLPATEREAVVSGMSTQNSKASEELEKSLFSFDDLAELADADLRRVIMGANYQEWGLALRGAPQLLIDGIFKQIPEGARAVAREAIESPQPRAKVLEMRSRILSRAQAMAERGEISLGERNATELI
jgi:flagellar motor switch protein FliG